MSLYWDLFVGYQSCMKPMGAVGARCIRSSVYFSFVLFNKKGKKNKKIDTNPIVHCQSLVR